LVRFRSSTAEHFKKEIAWFGSHVSLQKTAGQDSALAVGTEAIEPASVLCELGVFLDADLTMRQHIVTVSTTCFPQL
jgi:hypothetical protein